MLKFDKNIAYLVPVREIPVIIKFEDSNACPADFSIQCKYSKLNFEDDEMKVSCSNCYKDGCILTSK